MTNIRPNPVDDLEPDAIGEMNGKPLRMRRPIENSRNGYTWATHQVGFVVQETREVRVSKRTIVPLTVDLFHLKGFGRSFDEALAMAKGRKR